MQQLDEGFKLVGHSDDHTVINQRAIELSRRSLGLLRDSISQNVEKRINDANAAAFKESFIEMN